LEQFVCLFCFEQALSEVFQRIVLDFLIRSPPRDCTRRIDNMRHLQGSDESRGGIAEL
jgi:hypothetical protein